MFLSPKELYQIEQKFLFLIYNFSTTINDNVTYKYNLFGEYIVVIWIGLNWLRRHCGLLLHCQSTV